MENFPLLDDRKLYHNNIQSLWKIEYEKSKKINWIKKKINQKKEKDKSLFMSREEGGKFLPRNT